MPEDPPLHYAPPGSRGKRHPWTLQTRLVVLLAATLAVSVCAMLLLRAGAAVNQDTCARQMRSLGQTFLL